MTVSPPELTTRAALIGALTEAAELEHAVTCQYLFAACSLKKDPSETGLTWPQAERVRAWQATLLLVARQEMEHLGLVCNLLSAVGGTPTFRRPGFPRPAVGCPALETFDLLPFGEAALERFLCIEQAHSLQGDASAETIGDFYARIRRGLEHVGRANPALFIGPPAAQVTNGTIDLRPGLYDMNLVRVTDLKSAARAIDQIVEAGNGPAHERADSHYARFAGVLEELSTLRAADAHFEPARPVAPNPRAHPAAGSSGESMLVEHPVARQAVVLFNQAYETMTLMLARFYAPAGETEEERHGLKKLVFFPMMTLVLRPLGEALTRMPLRNEPGWAAGPSFEPGPELPLPPEQHSAWINLHERLEEMAAACGRLCADTGALPDAWARAVHPRLAFLAENLACMVLNFERAMNLKALKVGRLLGRITGTR